VTDEEKIAVGYEAAVDMVNAGGADNWARFNALLVSNSVLLAAVGFVLTEKLRVPVSIWASAGIACGFGILLCAFWWLLIWRGDQYIRYFNAVARELEGQLGVFNLFRRGREFGRGDPVNVGQGDDAEELHMRRPASFRAVRWMYAIIGLFAILYLVVFVLVVFSASSQHPVPRIEGWSLLIFSGTTGDIDVPAQSGRLVRGAGVECAVRGTLLSDLYRDDQPDQEDIDKFEWQTIRAYMVATDDEVKDVQKRMGRVWR
jgi:hypothetical protein